MWCKKHCQGCAGIPWEVSAILGLSEYVLGSVASVPG